MGCIRLRRWPLWSAGASEARLRFGSLGAEFQPSQSAVAAALCRRTTKGARVAYPPDSSVIQWHWGWGEGGGEEAVLMSFPHFLTVPVGASQA